MSDRTGTVLTRPTLVDGTVTILPPCACDWFGDLNLNGVAFEVGDIVLLTSAIFRGVPIPAAADPLCPVERGDLDCNGVLDVLDALRLLYVITGDWPYPEGICDPCGASSTAAVNTHTVSGEGVAR